MELIKQLILTAWDMWQHKVLHKTEDNWQEILEVEVNSQIARLYARGPDAFGTSAKSLLKQSEPDLIQLPLAYKTQWVATTCIAQAKCNKQKAGHIVTNVSICKLG